MHRGTKPFHHARAARRGFTLTELLVVVAIIVTLIGSLVVALGAAAKRAQAANTTALMSAISTGLGKFEGDFGYLPPVLGPRDTGAPASGRGRDVVRIGDVGAGGVVQRQQDWISYTTLAEYLIVYGHRGEDGYGRVAGGAAGPGDREAPPFGIRSPGPDGAFGSIDSPQPALAANPAFRGYYRARNPARLAAPPAVGNVNWNTQPVEGRVFGPYLDQIDERLLGGVTGYQANGRPTIVTADQGVPNFDLLPKVLLDYWGEPIAYYRRPYGGDDLRSTVADANGNLANLGDIYALRGWEIAPGDQSVGAPDASGDDSSSAHLKGASFALLSTGPDRSFNRTVRRDDAEFNKDNIVQTGR